jgi:hypothetical protein
MSAWRRKETPAALTWVTAWDMALDAAAVYHGGAELPALGVHQPAWGVVLGAEVLVAWREAPREAPALDAASSPSSPALAHLQVHSVGSLYPRPDTLVPGRLSQAGSRGARASE